MLSSLSVRELLAEAPPLGLAAPAEPPLLEHHFFHVIELRRDEVRKVLDTALGHDHRVLETQVEVLLVGVWGHSAGGYDSTHAILSHPEFYKVAVSSAGCHDNRMDKATWNEQWMGWPVDKHYEEQSNYTLAANLKGKLFLAHGDVDENVPLPATIKLVDALVTANKDFDFLIMPNRMHGFGNDPYFVRRRWDYFVRHLLGVDPRVTDARATSTQQR